MESAQPFDLIVGEGNEQRRIATLRRIGKAPGLFWLGGFRSEMTGAKASRIDAFGAAHGLAVTRFDYSGHGASGGDFLEGTISRWLEEALAVFGTTRGEQVVIGSSMGGWLALLLARALRQRGEGRIKALILIAPAVDMTEELMAAKFTAAESEAMHRHGVVEQPSEYSDEPYPITYRLIADGRQHLMLGAPIETGCPVTILQGALDPDVPPEHARKLLSHIVLDPVTLTLVPDGDHRLSREADLRLLEEAIARATEA